MVRHCPNCASALIFDPNLQALSCEMCGGIFDVSEFKSEEISETEEIRTDMDFSIDTLVGDYDYSEPKSSAEVYREFLSGFDPSEILEAKVYTCNSCGAEVFINDREVSTFCSFCGNPTLIFSRIEKQRKPKSIIPFKITREQAEEKLRNKLKKSFFIPKEIKNFDSDSLRGIYVPHYITSLTYYDSQVLSAEVSNGKHRSTIFFKRNAVCKFNKILSDSSSKLKDDVSQRLEPYDLDELVPFDEDYLLGHYADIEDVDEMSAAQTALERANKKFNEAVLGSIYGSSKQLRRNSPKYLYNDVPVKIMLPAYFLTYTYDNSPHTIAINGQTGKITGGIPWDKKKFNIFLAVLTLLLFSLSWLPLYACYDVFNDAMHEPPLLAAFVYAILFIAGFGVAILRGAQMKYGKVTESVLRTMSFTLLKYVNKRQEGK